MSTDLQTVEAMISQSLVNSERKSAEELRAQIAGLNSLFVGGRLTLDQMEGLARTIEERYAISIGLASVVDDGKFEPWLDDAKKSLDPYYWNRYKKLLLAEGLPVDVVTKLDIATEQILSRLGDPNKNVQWDRRGMVVGHVQSGKTANYTGLICKAADAGYRLIVVIAGIHNNLRNQTQERIDEGFIGRDTGRLASASKSPRAIGVGQYDDARSPVSLTTSKADFNKIMATNNKSQIDAFRVPVVLVIKKNSRTLKNLIDWLTDNSGKGDQAMIDQPMLLIDDEADNASINTKFSSNMITTINGQIRDLLRIFHRSCYVGYTATPFANIFIDPDQVDDMRGEDLFPKHFIIGLDAPTNYFGGNKVFIDGLPEEGRPEYLRFIDDNEDVLPLVHKIDLNVTTLPPSLRDAIRAFLIARTIRNLRGQSDKHASMLVNASRFTRVQGLIRNRIHEALQSVIDALRVNGLRGAKALSDPEIAELNRVFHEEFGAAGFTWDQVLVAMLDAVAATKVVEVNSGSQTPLDYSGGGQSVIAVGGYSLSRGLTLEGLTVTWFLRNTKMYDTLMQMGRWFGYRLGYEDLCRIWMPRDAVAWYAHIAEATDELHGELRRMEKAKLTPLDFGLAVRGHPSSLMVTARNKLGSGRTTVSIGLSSQFVETSRLSVEGTSLEDNRQNARRFIASLRDAGFTHEAAKPVSGGRLLQNVPVTFVDRFLGGWVNADQSLTTQIPPIRKYIDDRKIDELSEWDVLVGSLADGEPVPMFEHWPVVPMERKILMSDLG